MATLGCSQHVAYIQGKCNGPRLIELQDASLITYNRKLDDISTAQVVIPISGNEDTACCDSLKDVEPWCHQLTIVREGDGVVWTGPIQDVVYSKDFVTINASDKLGVLLYKVNEIGLCYSSQCGGVDNMTKPLTEIAVDIITLAMADDGDAQCLLDCIVIVPSDDPTLATDGLPLVFNREFFFPALGGPTAFDDLSTLAESGIDFTVINQCIILMSERLPVAAIGTLMDEMILGDVEVVKNGKIMGNRWYVRYEGDDDPAVCQANCNAGCSCVCPPCGNPVVPPCVITPCPGFAEGDEECYGAIERVIDGLPVQSVTNANSIAELYLSRGRIAPRQVILPSGTRLSPETPWALNDMIPGQRVNVALSKLCFPIFQSFKLQGMEVTDDGVDEEITIELLAVEQSE